MKEANTRYPINNIAKKRWSPRAFSPEPIPVEKLQSLFEAARWDVGQSVANLAVEAMNQGLYIHQMGGFSAVKAIEYFDIPDGYQPLTVIAAGYIGNADVLPENLKKRELAKRTRKEFNQFVFSSRFGQAADLFNI